MNYQRNQALVFTTIHSGSEALSGRAEAVIQPEANPALWWLAVSSRAVRQERAALIQLRCDWTNEAGILELCLAQEANIGFKIVNEGHFVSHSINVGNNDADGAPVMLLSVGCRCGATGIFLHSTHRDIHIYLFCIA